MNELYLNRLIIVVLSIYVLADVYQDRKNAKASTSPAIANTQQPSEEVRRETESKLIGIIRSSTEWSDNDKILIFGDKDKIVTKIQAAEGSEKDPSAELRDALIKYYVIAMQDSHILAENGMVTICRDHQTGGTRVTAEDKSILTL